MGLLTGKFGATGPFPEGRKKVFENLNLDTEQLTKLLDLLKSLSNKYNLPQTSIALNWCIVKGTVPLGGARTSEHVVQNGLALGFRLSDNEVAELDQFAFLGSNSKEWQHG